MIYNLRTSTYNSENTKINSIRLDNVGEFDKNFYFSIIISLKHNDNDIGFIITLQQYFNFTVVQFSLNDKKFSYGTSLFLLPFYLYNINELHNILKFVYISFFEEFSISENKFKNGQIIELNDIEKYIMISEILEVVKEVFEG
jgi:hypothetical protein